MSVYCLLPEEHRNVSTFDGKQIFKIGISEKNLLNRLTSYGRNSVIICSVKIDNASECEKLLIERFNKECGQPARGNEYFLSDEHTVKKLFFETVIPFLSNENISTSETVKDEVLIIEKQESNTTGEKRNESQKIRNKPKKDKTKVNKNCICQFCNKQFSRSDACTRHTRTCNIKPIREEFINQAQVQLEMKGKALEKIEKVLDEKDSEIQSKDEQINLLKGIIEYQLSKPIV